MPLQKSAEARAEAVLPHIIMPSRASVVVSLVLIICAFLVIFGFTYLTNSLLGFALSFAGILVGYESVYLLLKLTKPRSTD